MSCVLSPEAFETVLAPGALRTVFQPIARRRRATWEVAAFECLTRGPADTKYAQAPQLFAAGRAAGRAAELDRACVRTALETAAAARLNHGLFLNVLPETLAKDEGFPAFVVDTAARYGVPIEQLTLEITEHDRAVAGEALVAGIRRLERIGAQVAIDDFGVGPAEYSSLRRWRPRWMKVDGHLFREARRWSAAWQLIQAVVDDATRWGIGVIAEGLERSSDMWMAAELGIELLQGYYICGPLPADQAAHANHLLGNEGAA